MAASGEDYSVAHQLVLNLECLGFDLQSVVLSKIPARGLPPRYANFKLAADMFTATNSAAAEVVLFFIFEQMPWDAVGDCLPMTVELGHEEQRAVRTRLVENARHHLAELTMCFPCVELNQLTAFKKQAACLLELCKHMLPADMGHARRLLTEAGHRMAWVCMRLTSYIIQCHAIGRIDPVAITGGADTPARRRVLQAQVIRDTLRFQTAAAECVAAEKDVAAAAQRLTTDLTAAKATLARLKVAEKDAAGAAAAAGGARTTEDEAAAIRGVVEERRRVLTTIDRIYEAVPEVEGMLQDAPREQLTPQALEATWREARGAAQAQRATGGRRSPAAKPAIPDGVSLANYVAQHARAGERGGGGHVADLDLGGLARVWMRKLEALGNAAPKRGDASGGSGKNPRNAATPALDVDTMVAACDAQVAPLTDLLAALKQQNDEVEQQLRPKLETELARLEAEVAQHPLSCLMPPIDPSCIPAGRHA